MNQGKNTKPLTREQYLKQFSRSARWRLGAAEAEEAIADYHEMVFQPEREESRLVEELGDPVQAAWLLTDAKEYKRWIRVFAVLALGLFLMAKWNWTGLPFVRFTWDYSVYGEGWRGIAVMAVGVVLSLVWFRRHGQKSGPLSKWLILSAAAVLVFGLVVMGMTWHMLDPKLMEILSELDYSTMEGTSIARQIVLYREMMIDGGTVCAIAALPGLVLARVRDRRWLALYTLALTAAALCVVMEGWMGRIDLSAPSMASIEDLRAYLFPLLVPVGLAGLIGTGVALC